MSVCMLCGELSDVDDQYCQTCSAFMDQSTLTYSATCDTCIDNYDFKNDVCTIVENTLNCKTYDENDHQKCEACEHPYFLIEEENICISYCPDGYH